MRKLLQNTFFAAMLAWALQGLHAPRGLQMASVASGASIQVSMLGAQP